MIDPYQTLGVSKAATQDEIRKAYRKLARKHHPDMNHGDPKSEETFKTINQANDLIGTEEKRAAYDHGESEAQERAQQEEMWRRSREKRGPYYYETQSGPEAGRYSAGAFDEDILRSFFRQQAAGPREERYQMEVSFADAVLGAERQLTLPDGRTVEVKIPAGLRDGQTLKLRAPDAEAADVYITVTVLPSPDFVRRDNDLESDLPVSFDQAILGGEVRAKVIDGSILVRVPSGASTGQKLKVRGKGVLNPRTGERGDQYFNLKVTVPKTIDEELKDAVRAWSNRQPEAQQKRQSETEAH